MSRPGCSAASRVLIAAALTLCTPRTGAVAQQAGILHIKITIVDADRNTRPVPRHALLVSENPTTAAPDRTVTTGDGTAQINLRPGNYTVESDQPLIFQGKAYEWNRTVDVVAGRTTSLELTAENAQIEDAAGRQPASTTGPEPAASALLLDWQNSIVTIWSPTRRGAGFLIDARGLIATNQRLVGSERLLEVQLSPTEKVMARVLASDPDRNVAILWIDSKAAASARPMKLADADQPLAERDKLFTISTPMEDEKSLESGVLTRVNTRTLLSDIRVDDESLGAPLFNAAGDVIAITTPAEDQSRSSAADTLAVRIAEARTVIETAKKMMPSVDAPNATRLPIEGQPLFPDDPLRAAAEARKGALEPYRVTAADFDVGMITPLLLYRARHQGERTMGRERGRNARDPIEMEAARRALQDFGNWWDYVRRDPPVLMIRATPKLVESFWKTVLRGAAQTQGVSLPPLKQIKAGFARMRLFCGDAEVIPIHPFKIEHRIGEADAVYEGLYVFDPAAIGPHCGQVKLTLFSDKAPDKGDTRVVDPKILQQIWDDFAPYRAAAVIAVGPGRAVAGFGPGVTSRPEFTNLVGAR